MPTGRRGSIGWGEEATWGTAVAPTFFVHATESIEEERGRLREDMVFGTRSRQAADPGRLRISGAVNGIHARPAGVGHLLAAAIAPPATTGTDPFTHVYTPTVTNFSTEAALAPYSVTVKRKPGMVHRYSGGQLSRLALRQPRDDALVLDSDWMFKGSSAVSDVTMVLEDAVRFRYRHLSVQRIASPFNFVEDLTITLENGLESEETLNQSDEISAVEFGANSNIEVEMTLTFRDEDTYNDFRNNAVQAWEFDWEIDADNKLTIAIPRLNIERWSAPISAPGRMTVRVGGVAEFDDDAGHELQATLVNAVSGYHAA